MCAQSQIRANRIVLKDDPYNDPKGGDGVEFRLTYEGRLLAASRTDTRAQHKHEIRKVFHCQLKRLWDVTPHLQDMEEHGMAPPLRITVEGHHPQIERRIDSLANRFTRFNYRFVPLATRDLSLVCGIEILFLRADPPGQLLRSGDIDNRLKTLFDALRMPRDCNELGGYTVPDADENPFFCLMEDDSVVSRVAVETDTLLQPTGNNEDPNDARLVISVTVRPHTVNWLNLGFA